jgi:hypothetical protein
MFRIARPGRSVPHTLQAQLLALAALMRQPGEHLHGGFVSDHHPGGNGAGRGDRGRIASWSISTRSAVKRCTAPGRLSSFPQRLVQSRRSLGRLPWATVTCRPRQEPQQADPGRRAAITAPQEPEPNPNHESTARASPRQRLLFDVGYPTRAVRCPARGAGGTTCYPASATMTTRDTRTRRRGAGSRHPKLF